MPDAIGSAANNREILANRPDLLALLKATDASKAELNAATVRLEGELAALRAIPISRIAPAAAWSATTAY
jgi:hypothetical protein